MIDEQRMLYYELDDWLISKSFLDLHSIGVGDWLKPIRELMHPVDHKTPRLLGRVIYYMERQGDEYYGGLLKQVISVFLAHAEAFGQHAIASTKDKNDLYIQLCPGQRLEGDFAGLRSIMWNAIDMVRFYKVEDLPFKNVVQQVEIIITIPVKHFPPIANNRAVITRPALEKKMGWSRSTISKRRDFPDPINKKQKPRRYYVDVLNAYFESRNEPTLDVE